MWLNISEGVLTVPGTSLENKNNLSLETIYVSFVLTFVHLWTKV